MKNTAQTLPWVPLPQAEQEQLLAGGVFTELGKALQKIGKVSPKAVGWFLLIDCIDDAVQGFLDGWNDAPPQVEFVI